MNKWKNTKIIAVFTPVVIAAIFFIIGICNNSISAFDVTISELLDLAVLTIISYLFVLKDKEDMRKRDAMIRLIRKIQEMLSDLYYSCTDSDEERKIIRIKVKSVSNNIELLKQYVQKDPKENSNLNVKLIEHDFDVISSIIMDYIDDPSHLKKSEAEIYRIVTGMITNMEKISVDIV